MAQMFDYEKFEKELKLPKDTVIKIRASVREEFPKDDMMYELHLVRVYSALQKGEIKIEDVLKVPV